MSKDDGTFTISYRTIIRILAPVALVGLWLAFLGLSDAYAKVGVSSSAGHVITTALVIAAVAMAGVGTTAIWLALRSGNDD